VKIVLPQKCFILNGNMRKLKPMLYQLNIIYAGADKYTYDTTNGTKIELTHYEDSKDGTSGYNKIFKE
jgi:hypothetical protein